MSRGLITHGHTRGKKFTGTYSSWTAMLSRCKRPSNKSYSRYGGRGITVCDRWLVFESFLADMGIRPASMTLDRIDGGKGYDLANCRWATHRVQNMNKAVNPHFDFDGLSMTLGAWAEHLDLNRTTLQKRIYKLGWPIEKALSRQRHGRWGEISNDKHPGKH